MSLLVSIPFGKGSISSSINWSRSMQVEFRRVDWPYAAVFRISYREQTHAETILVELTDGPFTGRGEAMGVSYHGDTPESMLAQLTQIRNGLAHGLTREAMQSLLPPGGARNAVDCALWDLDAKRAGRRAWELAGLGTVSPIRTDFTLSLDTPEAMAQSAVAARRFGLLKLKLAGDGDLARVGAVREARADAEIIVDANQAWSEEQLHEFIPKLAALGVKLIEQPLPAGKDEALIDFDSPIPICADESCQTTASLLSLKDKYQYINIKLDKTGGLTEALALARKAKAHGFEIMVGCMGGSSLSIAPAFIIAQLASLADLDGPLLCSSDIAHPIRYEGELMYPPDRELWG
jgi:L-Ala-D/L-Glu epimerase